MTSPRDPTQFTRESAERIANVVRTIELTSPGARPLTFEREDFFRSAKIFRIATYTGAWPTATDKVVTFKNVTNTPNTASVTNLFFPVTNSATATLRNCAIAKEGTAWYLIDVKFETATAVFVSATQSATVFGTGSTSIIRFVGTAGTAQQTIATGSISAVLNTSACTISVTAATATVTSFSMSGTQTAVSVSMSGTQTLIVASSTFTSTFLRLE